MLAALIRKLAWSRGGFCRPFLYILKGNVTTSTAIWTLQTSNGDLQLEEQPKIKQLAHCDQTSWETALIYQAWRAVKCFPTFNCRCVRASGNCKPRGTSVWVLVFLTEQNKHLRGLWMRKVRAHSTHEKLIYSQPSPIKTPPREKGEKKKKKNPFKQVSLPSGTGLASPFDLRMNQLLVLWRPKAECWFPQGANQGTVSRSGRPDPIHIPCWTETTSQATYLHANVFSVTNLYNLIYII